MIGGPPQFFFPNNQPARLKKLLQPHRERGLFPSFPFGTDLTEEELILRKALLVLEQTVERRKIALPRVDQIGKTIAIPSSARPYLERMKLDHPRGFKERFFQRALVYA